jgi:anti-sigma factor RsiW
MTKVTRNVVHDLWPLYVSGDASPDSRVLVDEFLAQDPELARDLRAGAGGGLLAEPLPTEPPPDHGLKTLRLVKRRLWGYPLFLQLAMIFSCLAFGRIVSDTSWDVSPRNFIITAAIAGVFWLAFCISLYRGRRTLVVRSR